MRLIVAAVGRLGRSAEQQAIAGLTERIDVLARTTKIGPVKVAEIEDKSGCGKTGEAPLLLRAASAERRVVLDERGETLRSRRFAERLGGWRDAGVADAAFLIGGADGHTDEVRDGADLLLAFGAMTWPHALARLMLIEQLYRASTILAGHPYHREG